MFVAIFVAFLCLFHLLFIAKISTWSTLFETNRMLFQMSLFKFDVYELSDAASFWGPITFTLFIFVVVFVCMSMFLSIINQSFHLTRILAEDDNHHQIASKIRLLMIENLFRWFSLKRSEPVLKEEYVDSLKHFSAEMDRFVEIVDRVCHL